jgi:hypothetical protein
MKRSAFRVLVCWSTIVPAHAGEGVTCDLEWVPSRGVCGRRAQCAAGMEVVGRDGRKRGWEKR